MPAIRTSGTWHVADRRRPAGEARSGMKTTAVAGPAFQIEQVGPDETWFHELWHELQAPVCAGERPATRLVAREPGTERILGLAQYFRTFPPEDGCSAVVTPPAEAHSGAGEALFHELVRRALHDGMRTLGTMVSRHDALTLDLLRKARLPIRYHPVSGGTYIEIDLLTAAGQY